MHNERTFNPFIVFSLQFIKDLDTMIEKLWRWVQLANVTQYKSAGSKIAVGTSRGCSDSATCLDFFSFCFFSPDAWGAVNAGICAGSAVDETGAGATEAILQI